MDTFEIFIQSIRYTYGIKHSQTNHCSPFLTREHLEGHSKTYSENN